MNREQFLAYLEQTRINLHNLGYWIPVSGQDNSVVHECLGDAMEAIRQAQQIVQGEDR
jgi:hypothetical protein